MDYLVYISFPRSAWERILERFAFPTGLSELESNRGLG